MFCVTEYSCIVYGWLSFNEICLKQLCDLCDFNAWTLLIFKYQTGDFHTVIVVFSYSPPPPPPQFNLNFGQILAYDLHSPHPPLALFLSLFLCVCVCDSLSLSVSSVSGSLSLPKLFTHWKEV